jgi:hypothetical protein
MENKIMSNPKETAKMLDITKEDLEDTEYVLLGLISYLTARKESLMKKTEDRDILGIISGSIIANKRKVTRIIQMVQHWKTEL